MRSFYVIFCIVAVTGWYLIPSIPTLQNNIEKPTKRAALVCAATVGCMRWMHRYLDRYIKSLLVGTLHILALSYTAIFTDSRAADVN